MPLLFSLKRALTLNFLLVASVPVLLFGLINIYFISQHQLEGVRERNAAHARSIADEVESYLLEVRSDLLHINQTVAAENILQPASIDAFLSGAVQSSRFFESIYLLDRQNKIINLGLMSKLETRSDDYIDLDFSGHQVFRASEELMAPVWSDTFVSLVTGEPSVHLCVSGDGRTFSYTRLTNAKRLFAGEYPSEQPGQVTGELLN
jgi:hypothetical protein